MAQYVEFETADGDYVLVQIEDEPTLEIMGPVEAGVLDMVEGGIIRAEQTLESAWKIAYQNVQAFLSQVKRLAADAVAEPDEIELTFGVKVTGEGNMAVAKTGAEASYEVKLVWKKRKDTVAESE
jgi:hypothetical protein